MSVFLLICFYFFSALRGKNFFPTGEKKISHKGENPHHLRKFRAKIIIIIGLHDSLGELFTTKGH